MIIISDDERKILSFEDKASFIVKVNGLKLQILKNRNGAIDPDGEGLTLESSLSDLLKMARIDWI